MKFAISLETVTPELGDDQTKHRAILWKLSEDDKVLQIANVAEANDPYIAATAVTQHLPNEAYVGAVIKNGSEHNHRNWTIDWPEYISAAEAACARYGVW